MKNITIILPVRSSEFKVKLEPIQGQFTLNPIASVVSGEKFENRCGQYNLNYANGSLKIEIEWKFTKLDISDANSIPLDIDIAPLKDGTDGNFILLRGSLALNLPSPVNKKDLLDLWPTKDGHHLNKIHIEPAGLYVEGTLPWAFFEDLKKPTAIDPNASNAFGKTVLLRVWQDEWTLEPMPLSATDKFDASEFIKNYAEAFRSAETENRFIDNLVCRPEPKCSVKITRPSQVEEPLEMKWQATGLGTRIMIGSVKGPEAVFFPDRLEGRVIEVKGNYERPGPVVYASGEKNREAAFDISISGRNVIINNQIFVGLSVPAFPLSETSGSLAGRADPSQDSRSWLCTKTGWLSLDFASARHEFDLGEMSKSTFRGAIDINGFLGEVNQGIHLELTALGKREGGKREGSSGSFVALEMKYFDQKRQLTLGLQDVLAVFTTPSVWLKPIPKEDESKKSILRSDSEPYDPHLMPMIPWSLRADVPDGDRRALLEAELRPIFAEGIFVSKNALKHSDKEGLLCSIILEGQKFVMKFSGHGAGIWHRPAGYPLVQSHPLSQSYNNALILDPNRGLIPFQPDKETCCRLDFGESGLPGIVVQQKLSRSEGSLSIVTPPSPLYSKCPYLVKWTLPPGNVKRIELSYLYGPNFGTETEIFNGKAVTEHLWESEKAVTLGNNNFAKLRLKVWFGDGKKDEIESKNFKIVSHQSEAVPCEKTMTNGKANEVQLPELQIPPPIPLKKWMTPENFRGMRLFLPTIPGVEVTMSEEGPRWIYRHSIPALDQAYAESTQALSGHAGSAFSRVKGTEAFEIDSKSEEDEASGWIHKTEKNKTGSIKIKNITSAECLKGLNPVLSFDISDTISPKLGREHERSGLNGVHLDVKSTIIPGDNLPDFKVNLGIDPKTEEIVFEGQPLIVRSISPDQVVALDGEGLVQSEPMPAKTWLRPLERRERLALTRRLSLDKTEVGDKMVLDLTGVSMIEDLEDFNYGRESWELHDGQGGWPLFRGFPLYPLKLEISDSITIQATIMPRIPVEDAGRPDFAMGVVELKFKLPEINNLDTNRTLNLISIEGDIDWRWKCMEKWTNRVQLLRLKAKLNEKCSQEGVCPDALIPIIKELTLDLPIGPIRLLDSGPCKLSNGELEFDLKKEDNNGFSYELKQSIKANLACEPLQSEYISWDLKGVEDLKFCLLLLIKDGSTEWKLVLSSKGDKLSKDDVLSKFDIVSYKIGKNRYLFNIKPTKPTSLKWWKMNLLNGILGLEFNPPESGIKNHCLELMMEFSDDLGSRFMGVMRSEDKGSLSLEVTGSMKFENCIKFEKNGEKWKHDIDLFIDNVELPLECILSGKGPNKDLYLGAIASHTIKIKENDERTWQVPQIVRLTTIEKWEVLAGPGTFQEDQKGNLVVDLSSVFWLKSLGRVPLFHWDENPGEEKGGLIEFIVKRFGIDWSNDAEIKIIKEDNTINVSNGMKSFSLELNNEMDKAILKIDGLERYEFNAKKMKTGEINVYLSNASSQVAVESPSIRMILSPRETSSFQGGAHLMRLPAAVWKPDTNILVKIVEDNGIEDNRTAGIQPLVKPINGTNDIDHDIAYTLRNPNAIWLNSSFICSALKPDLGKECNDNGNKEDFNLSECDWPGLSPSFVYGDSKLPKEFGDLGWLEANGEEFLAAATLACKHRPNCGAQSLSGPTLFEFPFEVSCLPAQPNQAAVGMSNYHQLIYFDQGSFRRLAHKFVDAKQFADNSFEESVTSKSDEMAEGWAKAILKEKGILDSAFLLIDSKEIRILPRIIPEDLSHSKNWPMDAYTENRVIVDDPDPRCRHPTRVFRDVAALPSLITAYSSDESLGLMVYQAQPVKMSQDDKECVEGGASATRFRLAATSAGSAENEGRFQGKLRPARSCEAKGQIRDNDGTMSITQGKMIEISNREELEFVPYDTHYPRPNPRPFQEMPQPFNVGDLMNEQIETVLPPRLDAISWSARPGEMVRSDWHLRCHTLETYDKTGKKHLAINASRPFSIALRRPRTDAGNCSSIRLETIVTPKYLMNDQFYHAHFVLKQTVNRTAPPNAEETYIALVTKSNVHIGSPLPERAAKVNEVNTETRSLEDLGIYIVANSDIDLGKEERVILVAQKLLHSPGQIESSYKLPNLDQNGDLIPDGSDSYKLIKFVDSNEPTKFGLKFPPNVDDGWEQVTESSYAFEIREAKKTFEDLISKKPLGDEKSGGEKFLHLRLAKYIKNSDTSGEQYKCEGVLAHLYIILDETNSVSLSGRYSVSLISYPTNDNANAVLAGYTRLGADDFSLVRPGKKDGPSSLIYWFKAADLMLLDRMAWDGKDIEFDAVVYGPGGELIPNE